MMIWNGIFFNSPSSYIMEVVYLMNDYVSMFLFSIMLIVFINLLFTVLVDSFNLEFLEHHELEYIWTLIPIVVLVFIALPSFKCLYMMDSCLFCGMNFKIVGHQWYWSYFYLDLKSLSFDSYMNTEGSLRNIMADNNFVVPNGIPIRIMVTSEDVIHSWTIPSVGVKMDAIPGRINQICFLMKKLGVFYGQCSEICGANHSFMPIVMESIPLKSFLNLF